MTAGRSRIVDIWKVTVLRRFQSLVHTSWCSPPTEAGSAFFARCTKGIVHARRTGRGRELYGTNFRHAVEFSRSGRTPSRPFPDDRGQPEILYPVSSARSNTTGTARTPTWSGRSKGPAASCLGEHPLGPSARLASRLARSCGSVSRTRRTLARRMSGCKFRATRAGTPGFAGLYADAHPRPEAVVAGPTSVTWRTVARNRAYVRPAARLFASPRREPVRP